MCLKITTQDNRAIPDIIIPLVYNEKLPHYFNLAVNAIESVISQTIKVRLIISVEDSLAKAKNMGVEKSDNAWCMFLDADDYIDKDFVSNLIVKNNDVGILKPEVYKNGDFLPLHTCDLLKGNFLINGCVFKKIMYEYVGGTEDNAIEDWHLWAKILTCFDISVQEVKSKYFYIKTKDGRSSSVVSQNYKNIKSDISDYFYKNKTKGKKNLIPKIEKQ